jgi:PASTA domain
MAQRSKEREMGAVTAAGRLLREHGVLRRAAAGIAVAAGALVVTPLAAAAEPVTLQGRVSVVAGEDPSGPQVRYLLSRQDRLFELRLDAAQARALAPDAPITVRGTREGAGIDVQEVRAAPAASVAPVAPARAAAVVGTHSVLILRVFWNAADTVTAAAAVNQVASIDDGFYRENSYDRLGLTASATRWLRITAPTDCDDIAAINNATQDAADDAGITTDSFDHTMIYISSRDCVGRSWGQIGGRVTWIQGRMNTYRTAHELGHNFGLRHAHSKRCTSASGTPVPMGPVCTSAEYGDRFDVMGNVPPGTTEDDPSHLSAPQKNALGWLSGRSLFTDAGTYTLAPLESQPATLHAIRLNTVGQTFWLEYRRPLGADAPLAGFPGITGGVLVHETEPATGSWLLDMTAGSALGFSDAAIPVGGTWRDPTGRITVRVNSAAATGASVTLTSRLRTVPYVRELRRSAASQRVLNAGLVPRFTGSSSAGAWVSSQSPAPGTRVEPGSIVTMRLSAGQVP